MSKYKLSSVRQTPETLSGITFTTSNCFRKDLFQISNLKRCDNLRKNLGGNAHISSSLKPVSNNQVLLNLYWN